jgi:hypothetical protein
VLSVYLLSIKSNYKIWLKTIIWFSGNLRKVSKRTIIKNYQNKWVFLFYHFRNSFRCLELNNNMKNLKCTQHLTKNYLDPYSARSGSLVNISRWVKIWIVVGSRPIVQSYQMHNSTSWKLILGACIMDLSSNITPNFCEIRTSLGSY